MSDKPHFTAQEKAAWVTWRLASGSELTAAEIVDKFQITRQAADYILHGCSRVIPIYREGSRWRRFNHTAP